MNIEQTLRHSFALWTLACLLAVAGLMGCGSDSGEWSNNDSSSGNSSSANSSNGDSSNGDSSSHPECFEGLGECPTSDICVDESCDPIDEQSFSLTIEFAEFPWTRNFDVEVRYRGDDLIFKTSKSSSTSTPSWFETVELEPNRHYDWWQLEVTSHGAILTNTVLSCKLDFDAATFEKDRELYCDNDDGFLAFLIEAPDPS